MEFHPPWWENSYVSGQSRPSKLAEAPVIIHRMAEAIEAHGRHGMVLTLEALSKLFCNLLATATLSNSVEQHRPLSPDGLSQLA
jgi:hypothetical protein